MLVSVGLLKLRPQNLTTVVSTSNLNKTDRRPQILLQGIYKLCSSHEYHSYEYMNIKYSYERDSRATAEPLFLEYVRKGSAFAKNIIILFRTF